ncbi:MAG: DUF4760 domain-containing protein [Acidobacteriota bacterium]|nr:DUF4760 domain-containing protein [Acidobacteriota bacterium]
MKINTAELAPLVSAIAFVFSAIIVVIQLRNVRRDRFVVVTYGLFQIWQSPDFMKAQLWVMHELHEQTWEGFQEHHRGKDGEVAFMRVTGFYNRVGTLVNLHIVDGRVILRTIGGTALVVWKRVKPLIEEARRENPGFLLDFESLIPHCATCLDEMAMSEKRA